MARVAIVAPIAILALAFAAPRAAAQMVPRAGQGSVTFTAETIDHYGRLLDNGARLDCCGTTNVGLNVLVEYAITNRWAISAGLPYIFSRYRDGSPTQIGVPFLPYPAADACHCLHGTFQDFGFETRYNVINMRRRFALTPLVSVGIPSHAYDHVGEAVAGFGLKEIRVGADAEVGLGGLVPRLSVEGRYTYAVVPRVQNIPHNRSNALFDGAVALTGHVSVHGILYWQRTHGGLHFPVDVAPFPERYNDFHRLLQDNYLQAGGGVSYGLGQWTVSLSFLRAMHGTNSHEVRVYSLNVSRPFRIRR